MVGVAGNVHFLGLDTPVTSQFMRPYTQTGWPIMNIVVRTAYAPATFTAPIKRAIKAFSARAASFPNVETMARCCAGLDRLRRVPMLLLFGIFASGSATGRRGNRGCSELFGDTADTRDRPFGWRWARALTMCSAWCYAAA